MRRRELVCCRPKSRVRQSELHKESSCRAERSHGVSPTAALAAWPRLCAGSVITGMHGPLRRLELSILTSRLSLLPDAAGTALSPSGAVRAGAQVRAEGPVRAAASKTSRLRFRRDWNSRRNRQRGVARPPWLIRDHRPGKRLVRGRTGVGDAGGLQQGIEAESETCSRRSRQGNECRAPQSRRRDG